MYNAFTGLAASSARTRQQRCSQVSNNEASVFRRQTLIRAKMLSPHAIVVDPGVDSRQRSLRIRFPWTSAVDYHGMSTTRILLDATYTWRWLCALIYLSSSRPSRCELGIEKMHYSSKPAEPPTSSRRARFVTSPMRQILAETKR